MSGFRSNYNDIEFQSDNSLHLEQHKILLGSIEDFTKAINNIHLENDLEIKNLRESLSVQMNSNSFPDLNQKSQTLKEINMLGHDQDCFSGQSCSESGLGKSEHDIDLLNMIDNKKNLMSNKIFMSGQEYEREKNIQESPQRSKAFMKKNSVSPKPNDFTGKLKLSLDNLKMHSNKLFESKKDQANKHSESLCSDLENKISELIKFNEKDLEDQEKIDFDSEFVSGESKDLESLKKNLENNYEMIKNSPDRYLSYATPYFYQNLNSIKVSRQNSSANSYKDGNKIFLKQSSQKTSNFLINEPFQVNSQNSIKNEVCSQNKLDLNKELKSVNLTEDSTKNEKIDIGSTSSKKAFKKIGKSEIALNNIIQKFEAISLRNSVENPNAVIPVSEFEIKTYESNTLRDQIETKEQEDSKLLQNNILIEDLDESSSNQNQEKVQNLENCTKRMVKKISRAQIGTKEPNIIDLSEVPGNLKTKQNQDTAKIKCENKDFSESYQSKNNNESIMLKKRIGSQSKNSRSQIWSKNISVQSQNRTKSRYNEIQIDSNCKHDSTYGSTTGFQSKSGFLSESLQQESSLKIQSSKFLI